MSRTIDRIGICVPAHNEADTIAACVTALAAAARQVGVPVRVVLVADDCTDATLATAERAMSAASLPGEVGVVTARSVGAARCHGIAVLIDSLGIGGTWLATTDGDSTVPVDWLSRQLAYAAEGADVVAGTVAVSDWGDHPRRVRDHVNAQYAAHARPHGHIHGANLAFSATAYEGLGGFRTVESDEDVQLVRAAQLTGLSIAWADDIAVTTSARLHGRAPRGFAHYLLLANLTTWAAR